MMKKTESHICSECLFTGSPSLSVGRLFIEFFANLLLSSGWGIPLFEKVRHCPECGRHSMILIESETGQKALAQLKQKEESGRTPPLYTFEDFVQLLRKFVAGSIPFEEFKDQYWEQYNEIPENEIPETKQDMFNDIYEMMYMSEDDPVTKEDKMHGFVGYEEIKKQIASLLDAQVKSA